MADERGKNGPEVDVKLLELLACPLTKGPLTWDPERSELVSRLARLAYPVRGGIPIMLPSEARTLTEES
ncbi:Trm112 family protein [Aquamicrobium ahrensii]|uniref:Trm112 family protein n=1 Tax=Aquamicrobium ahrensii TaxID=469551 RepID=UPI00339155BA